MTTTVTKESLAARIAELESGARSLKEDYTLAAYKMLLATMEAEPVAWTWHYREQWHVTSDKGRAAFIAIDGDVAVLPLYRHAQPVPVVPEKCPAEIRDLISSHTDALFNDDDAQEIWNACRAAMLNQK